MRILGTLLGLLMSFPALGSLSVSPTMIHFGNVYVGSAGSTRYINVRNPSDKEVSVRVNDRCFGDFFSTNNCYGTLQPYGSCNITIRYSPRRPGVDSCSIYVSSSDGGSANIHIQGRASERRF